MSPGNWQTVAEWRHAMARDEPIAREIARVLSMGLDLREWAEKLWLPVNSAERIW